MRKIRAIPNCTSSRCAPAEKARSRCTKSVNRQIVTHSQSVTTATSTPGSIAPRRCVHVGSVNSHESVSRLGRTISPFAVSSGEAASPEPAREGLPPLSQTRGSPLAHAQACQKGLTKGATTNNASMIRSVR